MKLLIPSFTDVITILSIMKKIILTSNLVVKSTHYNINKWHKLSIMFWGVNHDIRSQDFYIGLKVPFKTDLFV